MVEQRTVNPLAVGSIPTWPANKKNDFGALVKLEFTPACHAGGHGFKSRMNRTEVKVRKSRKFSMIAK